MKTTLMAVMVGMMAFSAFGAGSNELEALKQAYEKGCVEYYGKALDAKMDFLKKKGDLDGYKAVKNEKTRLDFDKTVPETKGLPDTNGLTVVLMPMVLEASKVKLEYGKRYMAALDAQVKAMMQKDDMDGAEKAKAEKDKVAAVVVELEKMFPKAEKAEDKKKSEIADMLVGSWDVTNVKWKGVWTFNKDGTATISPDVKGTWRIESNRIYIEWSSGKWDSFSLPLSKSVRGDGWAGKGVIRGTKMGM